jgi:hypothetical protein
MELATKYLKLALLVSTSLYCIQARATGQAQPGITKKNIGDIYTIFLESWFNTNQSSFNLAKSARPTNVVGGDQMLYSVQCEGITDVRQLPTYSTMDTKYIAAKLPYIQVVEKWQPIDPDTLISHGMSEQAALKKAYANGLMILDAIMFNAQTGTAIFSYSFICGPLWGNGGVAIFHKTAKGWVRGKDCGSWVS